ncbi:MAG TPA: DMT family transporter [Cytophagaceae bacterium]|nr:DMT family transporter [Cytophagaceae bacterium]
MQEDSSQQKFLYGMIASMFCWGISWPVGKILVSYGDAANMAMLRFVLTFISLLILLIIIKENFSISKKGIPVLLGASVCMTLYSYFFMEGLHHGKAGAGGVLVTTLNPVLTYALTMIISWKAPSRREALGLTVGVIAGSVLLQIWQNSASIFDPGNLYFVCATITWAVLSKFTSLSSRYGSPASFSLWMYGICSIMMFVFTDHQATATILTHADLKFWGSLFFSATITTSLATTFYFIATSRIGADKASSYIFMVPLSAAIGSWLILGEVPLWNTLAGGLLGIAAVYILQKK